MTEVGGTYRDARGRTLKVREVHFGAADGREVVGDVFGIDGQQRSYATDAKIFQAVWVERRLPVPETEWYKRF